MITPRVLVVMPLYNARPYVRDAINSILLQTYQDFTLLVINDGSTDKSEEEVKFINDKRIILWNQENVGPGEVMNQGISYAVQHGHPFIARMDADDISLPERFEVQVRILEKFSQAVACSANCYYFKNDPGKIVGTSTVSPSPKLIRWEIFHGLRGMIQGACVFRTNALASIGGYRSKFTHAEEVDIFLRLAENYELRNSSHYLYSIRIREDSFSTRNIHQNVLYQFFAMDCGTKRRKGEVELDYQKFIKAANPITRYKIWHEEIILNLWRKGMAGQNKFNLVLAAMLDPKRVCARAIRKLSKK